MKSLYYNSEKIGAPHPVWIWTPDGASDQESENAYQIAKENGLIDGEHTFNVNVFPEKTVSSQPNLTKYSTTCKLRLVDRRSLLFYD